jgi:class 3 adenylate cyclase
MLHEAATAKICRGCWEQLHVPIVLRGPLAVPYRVFGVRPSRMNPNICTICETMFEVIMRRRAIEIDATILFADIRGYTTLAQAMDATALSRLLNFFYDECATAIWLHDGLLNKAIGDSVLAIFNFPLRRADHTERALAAARAIQTRCHERCQRELVGYGLDVSELGVGVGIDRGTTTFGEFGTTHTDLTAVGQVVNRAARLQSVARPGEILLSETAWQALTPAGTEPQRREVQLKGYDGLQVAYAC